MDQLTPPAIPPPGDVQLPIDRDGNVCATLSLVLDASIVFAPSIDGSDDMGLVSHGEIKYCILELLKIMYLQSQSMAEFWVARLFAWV